MPVHNVKPPVIGGQSSGVVAAPTGGSSATKVKTGKIFRTLSVKTGSHSRKQQQKWPISWKKGAQPGTFEKKESRAQLPKQFAQHSPIVVEYDPVRVPFTGAVPSQSESRLDRPPSQPSMRRNTSLPDTTPKKQHPRKGRKMAGPKVSPLMKKKTTWQESTETKHTHRSKVQIAVLGAVYDALLKAGVKSTMIPHATIVYGEKKQSQHTLSFEQFVNGYKNHLAKITSLTLRGIDLSAFKEQNGKLLVASLPNLTEIDITACNIKRPPSWLLSIPASIYASPIIVCTDVAFRRTMIGGSILERYTVQDQTWMEQQFDEGELAAATEAIPEDEDL